MKPAPFEYHRPKTVNEVVNLLATLENAKILAGGQSLMPMLNMRFVICDHVIDLNAIDELVYIREEKDELRIGALTRQRDIELSALVDEKLPVLREALRETGHTQTRNRGTMAGSLCHLDPAAEQPAIALLCDAQVVAVSRRGQRVIPISEFVVSYMTTQLEPDELVTEIRLPLWPKRHGAAFIEFARRHGDFAMASAGVMMTADGSGSIDRCAIAIGGVSSVPIRLKAAEERLRGAPVDRLSFSKAAECYASIDVIEDVHASASYRRNLARVLTERALRQAAERLTAQSGA